MDILGAYFIRSYTYNIEAYFEFVMRKCVACLFGASGPYEEKDLIKNISARGPFEFEASHVTSLAVIVV